jgi:ankyrin repeat protein
MAELLQMYSPRTLNQRLIQAIKENRSQDVRALLEQGASTNARDVPVKRASVWERTVGVVFGLPVSPPKALFVAVGQWSDRSVAVVDNPDIVAALLAHGARVNDRDESGATALMYAVVHGLPLITQVLITNGADVNARSRDGGTVLSLASSTESPEIEAILASAGARVRADRRSRWDDLMSSTSPLAQAVFKGDTERASKLLDCGGDPNSTTHVAYQIASDGACSASFSRPLIGRYQPEPGMPLLATAAMQGNYELVQKLISRGAEVNRVDKYGQTALILAAWSGYEDIVSLLLDADADTGIRDGSGKTALMWAKEEGHTEVSAVLRDAGSTA